MTALAERTKIRRDEGLESSTISGLTTKMEYPNIYMILQKGMDPIEATVYTWPSGSIRLQTVSYFPRLSYLAKNILTKITHYRNLQVGWDSNGALPPTKQVIDKANAFVSQADDYDLPFYFTAPGPNGEIVIEFKKKSKTAEVYFNEDGTSEMILYNENLQVYEDVINIEILSQHLS